MNCPSCKQPVMRDQRIAATSHPGIVGCLACGHKWKSFTEHVTECLDNTAATVRSWRKPHLRLHVGPYGWWVTGPKGQGWNFPKPHQAVHDYMNWIAGR